MPRTDGAPGCDFWRPPHNPLSQIPLQVLDDVQPLMEEDDDGFTPDASLWTRSGWREMAALSRRVAGMKDLKRFIAELGRGSGMGRVRRAPAQARLWGRVVVLGLLAVRVSIL